nr:phosphoribosylaminoimidazole carboxylase, chloroplastic [Quercus suber]
MCHIVKALANVSWDIWKHATDVAYKAVSSLEGAGVFAVELFLTGDGQAVFLLLSLRLLKMLLNEVAPRPHNSGHHTIESWYTSQFEQHLQAVVGLPLGEPSMKTPAAVMYTILGEDEFVEVATRIRYNSVLELDDFVYRSFLGLLFHWYDKPEMRKQQKMGHVTIVGPSMGDVEERLKSILKEEGSDCQAAVTPCVGIIMGSDSDLPVMKDAARILNMFGVPYEVKIVSAHWTLEMIGIQIIIAGAGGAAHLPGMVAALTPLPVIGVPVRASAHSLLSIVQMPRGVPVATVAINNAANAGLFAVRMMGIHDADLLARMSQYQEDTRNDVLRKAEKLEKDGWESYLNP